MKTYETDVVGESFHIENIENIVKQYASSDDLDDDPIEVELTGELILDNSNQYDSNAVAVLVQSLKVGHLSRSDAVLFRQQTSHQGLNDGRRTNVHALVRYWPDDGIGQVKICLPNMPSQASRLDLAWPPACPPPELPKPNFFNAPPPAAVDNAKMQAVWGIVALVIALLVVYFMK